MVSLVLLNYNSRGFLARALESIEAQTAPASEVIAVDNGSTGESLAVLEAAHRRGVITRLVRLERNEGFAQGMNVGLDSVGGDLVVALNSDVYLAPTFVGALARAVEESHLDDPRIDIGSLAVPVYRWRYDEVHDELTDDLQDVGVCLVRRLNVNPWHPALERAEALIGPDGSVQVLTRAGLRAARSVFGHVYDPTYVAYGEDIDLYVRLHSLGYRCLPVYDTAAWHIGSASSNSHRRAVRKPLHLQFLAHANKWRTLQRLESAADRWRMIPWMLAEDVVNLAVGPHKLTRLRGYASNYVAALGRRAPRSYAPVTLPFAGTAFSRAGRHLRRHGRLPPLPTRP